MSQDPQNDDILQIIDLKRQNVTLADFGVYIEGIYQQHGIAGVRFHHYKDGRIAICRVKSDESTTEVAQGCGFNIRGKKKIP